ncbi:hypothetical protein V9T40_002573 [Parthenolecanium corni]|uniref:U6 snRNA phosphodiesterase n=1 Tax=Parthenolecanium corni TaxID=536013 RepID=A0AAN9TGY3_9HEMI
MSGSNALSLIGDAYNSDEEENSDSVPKQEIPHKTLKLPVPESLKKLFCDFSEEEVLDMPELHGGRIRSFPHERGNWATCIFIPYKRSSLLSQVCDSFIRTCDSISKFSECDEFHLSLSRTVIIRHHWIEPLVRDIESKIKSLERFPVDFNDIGVYVNDEKTRTFIALKVGVGYQQLMNCVTAIDQCLSEFRLPTYYEDPSFHLSLIWCVGDKKEELTNLLPVLKSQYHSLVEENLQSQFIYVNRVCCKTGNRLFSFELKW